MNHAQRPSIIAVIVGVGIGALYFMWHFCDAPTFYNMACGK
jgi:hypothetical protein